MLPQLDQLLASVGGVFAGIGGCWLVLRGRQQRPRPSRPSYAYTETPAITSAAYAKASCWYEVEKLLFELQESLQLVQTQKIASQGTTNQGQAQQIFKQINAWISQQKRAAAGDDDTAAVLQQRAAEDELILQWINDNPSPRPAEQRATQHCAAPPELALTQIASELLPFNPIAVRLIGKSADADMSAAVERIEKLLASVDPPEALGTLPLGAQSAPSPKPATIRDPQGRSNLQPEDPQRRRSDQAIIYDTLLRRCLGDDDFAWRMLHKFPPRCRTEMESLSTEIRRRAWTSATRRITQLRGIAANLAADNLRDALANLETVCRQQSATRADQLLEGVYAEFQQVLDYIALAEGVCQPPDQAREVIQPLSRWPAGLLMDHDEIATKTLELSPAARVI